MTTQQTAQQLGDAALTARIDADNAQRAHDAALTTARATYGERPPQPIQDQLTASWTAVLTTREAERQADAALKAYIDAQHNRHDVCNETAYGNTQRLSFSVRVF